MVDFKRFVFIKNAVNEYGQFFKGDRAQGRFPKALVDSYLAHGILQPVEEPIVLDEKVQNHKPPRQRKA